MLVKIKHPATKVINNALKVKHPVKFPQIT